MNMKALILQELRLTRRSLLIWLGLILMLSGFAYFEYLSMKDSLAELSELMNAFPKILLVMFGIEARLDSALGWYGCIYYWVTILTYSYAVYLGVSCMTRKQAQGTAEYLFTKPVRRETIVMAKALACIGNLFVLAAFSGLCSYVFFILPLGGLEQHGAALTTTVGMFFTELVLFALALLIAGFAKTYKHAARLGASMLLGFYGIQFVAGYLELPALYYLTPLKYFDVYAVARAGFNVIFLLLTVVIVVGSLTMARTSWNSKEL